MKQIVKYERQHHLDSDMRNKIIKPQGIYESKSTNDNANDKLYRESLIDKNSTLKTSGSLSMLPRDFFNRHMASNA